MITMTAAPEVTARLALTGVLNLELAPKPRGPPRSPGSRRVPGQRVQQPRPSHRAGQAAAERADHGAERDHVPDPVADVGGAPGAEQGGRGGELPHACRARAEA